MFWSRMQRIPKRRGKMVFLLSFLDPSSPRLASGSPGWAPARLGELPWSRMPFFAINKRDGRLRGGSKVQKWRDLRDLRKKKKKEEETKLRYYRIVTVINLYIVPCSVFFVRPSVSFVFLRFWCDLSTLSGPPVIMCTSIFFIYHRRSRFSL